MKCGDFNTTIKKEQCGVVKLGGKLSKMRKMKNRDFNLLFSIVAVLQTSVKAMVSLLFYYFSLFGASFFIVVNIKRNLSL